MMQRAGDRNWQDTAVQASPVLVAVLLAALFAHLASGGDGWAGLALRLGHAALVFAPLLLAHLAACRWPPRRAAAAWLAGFALYPALLLAAGWLPPLWHWAMAALLSLAFLTLHPAARSTNAGQRAAAPVLRLPVTLDGTMAALLALWALGATALFASTPDAVRNQPLRVWFNWRRWAQEPLEVLWYLVQFGALAALLFGWYWLCRHLLVRRLLRRHGVLPFVFALATLLAIGPPLAATLGLLLPINLPEFSVIPSEDHNPFAADNYRFATWLTAVLLPLILTVERLLAEQAAAATRHESARAELARLHQQINPHFLFNTLNTLTALCLKGGEESAGAVIRLSNLLRHTVYRGEAALVPLDEEMAYLHNYLDLQMLRFGHRCQLSAAWPVSGSGLGLPPLLLIMLVENAFKHGVEPVEGPCTVRIAMARSGHRLTFTCANSLPDAPGSEAPGLGLGNLRRRLELLYGGAATLTCGPRDGLWQARLELELAPC